MYLKSVFAWKNKSYFKMLLLLKEVSLKEGDNKWTKMFLYLKNRLNSIAQPNGFILEIMNSAWSMCLTPMS